MKNLKYFMSALVLGASVLVACGDKNGNSNPPAPNPNPGPSEEFEIPELDKPGAGKVTIALYAEGDVCEGIYFRGRNGNDDNDPNWTTKGIGDFTAIPDHKGWYQVTIDVYADPFLSEGVKDAVLSGKGCLRPDDSANWDFQWVGLEQLDGSADFIIAGENQLVYTNVNGDEVIYCKISGWKGKPCVENEEYTITVKVPARCEAAGNEMFIVGSFAASGWGVALPMTLDGDVWVAKIMAQENNTFKVRGSEADWSIEIQGFDATKEEWGGVADNVLSSEKNVVVDYSDAEKYRWNVCAE